MFLKTIKIKKDFMLKKHNFIKINKKSLELRKNNLTSKKSIVNKYKPLPAVKILILIYIFLLCIVVLIKHVPLFGFSLENLNFICAYVLILTAFLFKNVVTVNNVLYYENYLQRTLFICCCLIFLGEIINLFFLKDFSTVLFIFKQLLCYELLLLISGLFFLFYYSFFNKKFYQTLMQWFYYNKKDSYLKKIKKNFYFFHFLLVGKFVNCNRNGLLNLIVSFGYLSVNYFSASSANFLLFFLLFCFLPYWSMVSKTMAAVVNTFFYDVGEKKILIDFFLKTEEETLKNAFLLFKGFVGTLFIACLGFNLETALLVLYTFLPEVKTTFTDLYINCGGVTSECGAAASATASNKTSSLVKIKNLGASRKACVSAIKITSLKRTLADEQNHNIVVPQQQEKSLTKIFDKSKNDLERKNFIDELIKANALRDRKRGELLATHVPRIVPFIEKKDAFSLVDVYKRMTSFFKTILSNEVSKELSRSHGLSGIRIRENFLEKGARKQKRDILVSSLDRYKLHNQIKNRSKRIKEDTKGSSLDHHRLVQQPIIRKKDNLDLFQEIVESRKNSDLSYPTKVELFKSSLEKALVRSYPEQIKASTFRAAGGGYSTSGSDEESEDHNFVKQNSSKKHFFLTIDKVLKKQDPGDLVSNDMQTRVVACVLEQLTKQNIKKEYIHLEYQNFPNKTNLMQEESSFDIVDPNFMQQKVNAVMVNSKEVFHSFLLDKFFNLFKDLKESTNKVDQSKELQYLLKSTGEHNLDTFKVLKQMLENPKIRGKMFNWSGSVFQSAVQDGFNMYGKKCTTIYQDNNGIRVPTRLRTGIEADILFANKLNQFAKPGEDVRTFIQGECSLSYNIRTFDSAGVVIAFVYGAEIKSLQAPEGQILFVYCFKTSRGTEIGSQSEPRWIVCNPIDYINLIEKGKTDGLIKVDQTVRTPKIEKIALKKISKILWDCHK